MNWISNYVRPKINSLFSRREVPENLWVKCDSCGTMLFHRELADNLNVCTNCGHHLAISPRDRFPRCSTAASSSRSRCRSRSTDPLGFKDQKKYPDRLREARKKTGEEEAMLVAEGEIGRLKVVCAGQDFAFMGGSMGMYVGNAIVAAAERAVKRKCPLVLFAAAGGARMQEGILSLMQMPRSTVAVEMLKEAGLPYVVVLTHPTTGGVTASYAMLGDIQIAEPGALICFAGPRVIEQTIRETLPEGFQRAEYLLDHGMLDRVVPRKDLRDELATMLRLLTNQPRLRARRPAARPSRRPPRPRHMTPPAATAVLERLTALHPKVIDLSLDRIERLLAALGHPERRLPPVVHVAGTNGKGSVVAMLRAGLEAAGAARPRLHLAAPRPLPRAHPPRRRADRRGPRSIAAARALRGGERRRADHLLRDHHRRGLPRHGRDAGRLRAARGRPRRPARRDQRGRPAAADRRSPRSRSTTSSTSARRCAEIAGEKAGILKPGVPCVVGRAGSPRRWR